ncbi:MAG: hypothetical protein AD073_000002 [Mycoplasmataceae bacterium]|nr:MAG: hypothetical protein AD073_000002 [Mycoplasmataceae bacterium]
MKNNQDKSINTVRAELAELKKKLEVKKIQLSDISESIVTKEYSKEVLKLVEEFKSLVDEIAEKDIIFEELILERSGMIDDSREENSIEDVD